MIDVIYCHETGIKEKKWYSVYIHVYLLSCDITEELHSRGITMTILHLHKLYFKSFNKITKFNFLFIGPFFVVIHCPSRSLQLSCIVLLYRTYLHFSLRLVLSGKNWSLFGFTIWYGTLLFLTVLWWRGPWTFFCHTLLPYFQQISTISS